MSWEHNHIYHTLKDDVVKKLKIISEYSLYFMSMYFGNRTTAIHGEPLLIGNWSSHSRAVYQQKLQTRLLALEPKYMNSILIKFKNFLFLFYSKGKSKKSEKSQIISIIYNFGDFKKLFAGELFTEWSKKGIEELIDTTNKILDNHSHTPITASPLLQYLGIKVKA
jgi:hypothetical protein